MITNFENVFTLLLCILHLLKSSLLAESSCQQIRYTWHTDKAFTYDSLSLQKVTILTLNKS